MRSSSTLAALLCVGLTAWTTGCSRGSSGPDLGLAASKVAQDEPAISTGQLLARIANAATQVPYHGTRRVRMNYRVVGVLQDLEYTERVVADGEGLFGIEMGEVVSPRMAPDEEELFRILQSNRQGFFYRYRDFSIRDLDLFNQGYRTRLLGWPEVCGRDCIELEVRHRDGRNRWYTVAIDPRTGLVMRSDEHAGPGGDIVASVEFETFALGLPPAAGPDEVPFFTSSFQRDPVDLGLDNRPQVGFRILRPTLLPDGYRLQTADSMLGDGDRTWVRLVYGDGVEQVFFLHSPVLPAEQSSGVPIPISAATTGSASDNGMTSGTDLRDPRDPHDDRVTVASVGPWTVIDGVVRGQSVVAMGKVDEPELLQMVQSALESRSGN